MKITVNMLQSKYACRNQVVLFHQLFGDEVVLTKEIVMEHGHKFHLDWFIGVFMNRKVQIAYEAAVKMHQDAYNAAVNPHRHAFYDAIQPHWDAYQAAIRKYKDVYNIVVPMKSPHWDAYEAAIQPHEDAYEAAVKPHRDALLKAESEAFWNAISNT